MNPTDIKSRPCRHATLQPDCPACKLIAKDDRYAHLRGPETHAPTAPAKAKAARFQMPLPCIYRGPATGETRPCKTCTATTQVQLLSCGVHGVCTLDKAVTLPNGRPVQSCRACTQAIAPARAGMVRIPPFAALTHTPRSRLAVVTVASGAKTQELFAVSRPLMESYAARVGADLVILDQPGPAAWPMGAKFAIHRALERYGRIFYVDADVVLRPSVPNMFEAVPRDKIALWSDLADVLRGGGGFVDEFVRFRETMGFSNKPPFRLPAYWNTGVFVASREHLPFFEPPAPHVEIPILHCAEQHWFVSQLLDGNAPVMDMPREFNWQWWADPDFAARPVPREAILHFSGWTGPHEQRVAVMREWSKPRLREIWPGVAWAEE